MRSPIAHHELAPDTRPDAATAAPSQVHPEPTTARWRSSELLGSAREVAIEHGGQIYRLRLTALGKLILTK
jgi:hemin uptake protein HemP